MPPAQVDGSRLLYQVKEYWQMIKINNQKLEKQIKEILQHSSFASVDEYLVHVVKRDAAMAKKGGLQ